MSSDIGMGYNLGGYFDIMKNLTVGISYQSAIDMKYKNQISTAATGFGLSMGRSPRTTSRNQGRCRLWNGSLYRNC